MTADQLTPHFKLIELVRTSHRTIDNSPPPSVVEHLRTLCEECLEPLRSEFGPLYVTSGFRSMALNSVIGGARDSAHMYGCAADLVPLNAAVTLDQMIAWVAKSQLPFDQVIIEHSSNDNWLHIGMLRPFHEAAPRHQVLRFNNGIYSMWVPPEATV